MTLANDISSVAVARQELALRKRRNAFLGGELFGEPAWDMLLELFVAEAEGRKVSVAALCHGLGVPFSTATRWLLTLERAGRVARTSSAAAIDGSYVTLTLMERSRLNSLLESDDGGAV